MFNVLAAGILFCVLLVPYGLFRGIRSILRREKNCQIYKEKVAQSIPLTDTELKRWRSLHPGETLNRVEEELSYDHFDLLRQYALYGSHEEMRRSFVLLARLAESLPAFPDTAFRDGWKALLHRFLRQENASKDCDTLVEVMQQAEKIGDAETRQLLRYYTTCSVRTPEQDALQKEARRILLALDARREREKATLRLVRPADAPGSTVLLRPIVETNAETLLRPARGVPETETRLLVRPAAPEDSASHFGEESPHS